MNTAQEGLCVLSSWNGTYEKATFGSFETNSFFKSVDKIFSQLLSFPSWIKSLGKMSNCHQTCFRRWSHHVHDRSTVRNCVGQRNPHDLIRFCDECGAVGYFVLLFLVQRHTLVLVQVWRNVSRSMNIFAHER